MTCLTVTPDSAAEAVEDKVQLIVSHHPILFRGVKRLTDGNPEGRMLLALVRAGVAVYSPHSAFDNTRGGINDQLAQLLGLKEVVPLRRQDGSRSFKVVVFVPDKDLQPVAERPVCRRGGTHWPVPRVQFSPGRHRHFLRLRGDQPDGRSERPSRGGQRMAAGGGLSRKGSGSRAARHVPGPLLRGTRP